MASLWIAGESNKKRHQTPLVKRVLMATWTTYEIGIGLYLETWKLLGGMYNDTLLWNTCKSFELVQAG